MSVKSLDAIKQIMSFVSKGKGFDRVLNKVQVISGGEGSCVCSMKVGEEHGNKQGVMHGGMTATLVDMVSTTALMTTGTGEPGVSVNMNISYLKAGKIGEEIIIDASAQRVGRNLAFLTVDVKSKETGQLIATGQHTKFVGKGKFKVQSN